MMFEHEHEHHGVVTTHPPDGPAPLWCKVACALALVLVAAIAQPWRPW